MRDHNDGPTLVGQTAHQVHESGLGAGIQARGWFIQEEQARAGEQFDADGDTLLLAAAQPADLDILAVCQVQIIQHFHDPLMPLGLAGVLRHAQLGGEIQCLVDRQFHVDDVFLRDVTDIVADGIEILINIDAVDKYLTLRGRPITGNGIHQGGFSTAALSHHHDEFALAGRPAKYPAAG